MPISIERADRIFTKHVQEPLMPEKQRPFGAFAPETYGVRKRADRRSVA
jgi:hypothetical protein